MWDDFYRFLLLAMILCILARDSSWTRFPHHPFTHACYKKPLAAGYKSTTMLMQKSCSMLVWRDDVEPRFGDCSFAYVVDDLWVSLPWLLTLLIGCWSMGTNDHQEPEKDPKTVSYIHFNFSVNLHKEGFMKELEIHMRGFVIVLLF